VLKRTYLVLLACVLVLLSFTGCTNTTLKNNNTSLNNEIISVKQKNSDLEKKVSELTNDNQKLGDRVKELESNSSSINESMSKIKEGVFPIYTANIDSLKRETYLWVYVDVKSPIKAKLGVLAKTLSEVYFRGLPIEIGDIKDVNGKKIAVVNLSESAENQKIKDTSNFKGPSWAGSFFQGSTGGGITSTSLIETMLQRDYKGAWIDGVQFKYNNKNIDYEHVPDLNAIAYR
jgi:cell division protein FtsL